MPESEYEELARKVEWIFSLVAEVNAAANDLHVPIPQSMARVWAEWGVTYPAQIREVGKRPPDAVRRPGDEAPREGAQDA
jgi:hypothetical protein